MKGKIFVIEHGSSSENDTPQAIADLISAGWMVSLSRPLRSTPSFALPGDVLNWGAFVLGLDLILEHRPLAIDIYSNATVVGAEDDDVDAVEKILGFPPKYKTT